MEKKIEPLFRTSNRRGGELTGRSLLRCDVSRMIHRRALLAGIKTEIGCLMMKLSEGIDA